MLYLCLLIKFVSYTFYIRYQSYKYSITQLNITFLHLSTLLIELQNLHNLINKKGFSLIEHYIHL